MYYLNEIERQEVNIIQGYPRRKLTKVETAVENLVKAIDWYNFGKVHDADGNEVEGNFGKHIVGVRKAKVDEAIADVRKVTNSPDVILKCHQAVNSEDGKHALLAQYPYLKHSYLIFCRDLFGLQRLATSTIHSKTDVERTVQWLRDLIQVAVDLGPCKGIEFVGTPTTPYNRFRSAAARLPELFKGHAIRTDLQERVNTLFNDDNNWSRDLLWEYNLTDYQDLEERFDIKMPKYVDGNLEIVAKARWSADSAFMIDGQACRALTLVFANSPTVSENDVWGYRFIF